MSKSDAHESKHQPERRRRFTYGFIISVMNSIGTAWVFVLLVIINLDIGGRALFGRHQGS